MKISARRVAGAKTLAEIDATFTPAQRALVKRRMKQLEQEELTLADLRKAYRITQVDLAKRLGVKQASVSQVENSTDLYLSTLRKHIEAMGGELALTAKFPNRSPVAITLKERDSA
jgi:predicted transcriptional regulator